MVRNILIIVFVYFIYRGIKYLIKLFLSTRESDKSFTNKSSGNSNKSIVDKKDIIDAEFEDIDESEKSR